jgi:hypothetical protein
MVKCTKSQIRKLKTALRWKLPAAQRERIQMVLLRESVWRSRQLRRRWAYRWARRTARTWPMMAAGLRHSNRSRLADASARIWRLLGKKPCWHALARRPGPRASQIAKLKERFGLERVVLVGDRLRIAEIVLLPFQIGAYIFGPQYGRLLGAAVASASFKSD